MPSSDNFQPARDEATTATLTIYARLLAACWLIAAIATIYRIRLSAWDYTPSATEIHASLVLLVVAATVSISPPVIGVVHALAAKRAFPLLASIAILPVTLFGLFICINITSDCEIKAELQEYMRANLSESELKSVRAFAGICPTGYSFRNEQGDPQCATGSAAIFGSNDIGIGSCG
ncbi:hypothetical protein [Jeongeupia naejangsanensis]|uniref:Uncharacterized protein n=1 Tax=Jeongeupia naejangsanensis TaxID=613195 RepID=A0ABS2BPF3_9NEIS|nr:hypothetical protein [Jeongeupia naejangsanensis]MBM3117295.1 hypothetical protein [Jeongeupia naejangsanensis]